MLIAPPASHHGQQKGHIITILFIIFVNTKSLKIDDKLLEQDVNSTDIDGNLASHLIRLIAIVCTYIITYFIIL